MAMSMNLHTGYDVFLQMPVFELIETCEDLRDMQKEAEREMKRR
jgi:hypothetical protein